VQRATVSKEDSRGDTHLRRPPPVPADPFPQAGIPDQGNRPAAVAEGETGADLPVRDLRPPVDRPPDRVFPDQVHEETVAIFRFNRERHPGRGVTRYFLPRDQPAIVRCGVERPAPVPDRNPVPRFGTSDLRDRPGRGDRYLHARQGAQGIHGRRDH